MVDAHSKDTMEEIGKIIAAIRENVCVQCQYLPTSLSNYSSHPLTPYRQMFAVLYANNKRNQ